MKFIDTHAHIYLKDFKQDITKVIEKSDRAGIEHIFLPNIDHTTIDNMLELEEKYPQKCLAMMGLHPCSVNKGFEKELYLVEEWLGKKQFLAVGEMGIDLYWDKTFFEQQKEAFKIQVELAKRFQLPIVIHCRDSFEETISLVEELNSDTLTGVFHCFSGSVADAKRIVDLQDFYMGLGGVSTFKNSGMDKVIPELDMEYVVIETDSPYLTPAPHRGTRNEPAYIPLIAQKIAELQNIEIMEVAEVTTKNAKKLFKIGG